MQDKRELVKHQGRAEPENGGGSGSPGQVEPRRGEPGDAADGHQDHTEHHVVDVHGARDQVRLATSALPRE